MINKHQLEQAAIRVADDENFKLVVHAKLEELKEDILISPEDAQILAARKEYEHIRDFGHWIIDLAQQGSK